ncbi:MAG: hypothetical protein HOM03_12700 [Marinovum sp.]|nr:hypothetical protein [Marinovum sp.]
MKIIQLSKLVKRRYIHVLQIALFTSVLSVILLNNVVFQMMRSSERISTSQMIPGWSRIYKPLMYDVVKPDAVSFGYSWVRDLFDPDIAEPLLDKSFFNFGLSGATSFESMRLIQSSLATHVPEHAFLDIRAFPDAPRARLLEHQFDERILHVNRDGSENNMAPIYRWIKVNTGGAALAFNLRFLNIEQKLRFGAQRESLLPPYEQRDWALRSDDINFYRALVEQRSEPNNAQDGNTYEDLKKSIGLLCEKGVKVHIYDAPWPCSQPYQVSINQLNILRDLGKTCQSLTYHMFGYPNVVTMEGLQKDPGQSLFYRPDGHPRPTAGQLILTQILDLQDTDAAPSLPSDFGQDLLKLPEAQAALWVKERAARCEGKWAAGAYKDTLSEMGYLFSKWRRGDLIKSSEND